MLGEGEAIAATGADRRTGLADLVAGLSEARDAEAAAERLVEHLVSLSPNLSARVYLLGPGDRCATCPRARDCHARDRCLHLVAGSGSFAQTQGLAERVPRHDPAWATALAGTHAQYRDAPPPELAAPGTAAPKSTALFVPIRAGGESIGVAGIRLPPDVNPGTEESAAEAAFLTGAAVGAAMSRAVERRRFEQLLLVNDLGRKVNSILNLDLLMKQAVVDLQRTFGFRHVSLFVVDRATKRITLKAQSSGYLRKETAQSALDMGQGIVGRVARSGTTVRVEDVTREGDYINWWPDSKSEVAVPVRIGGVVEAVINVESDMVGAFGEADVIVLETAAHQLAIAIENARLFGRVKESEEEYRTLVESASITVLQVDTHGRLTYANPALADLTGLDRSAALARLESPSDLAVQEDRDVLAKALAAAASGEPQRGIEFRTMHADGRMRFVAAEIQPLVAEGGVKKGVLLLARNISRERELQAQLAQSERLKAMGEMVSGVAHELNNPLAGILGFAQLFLTQPTERWSRHDVEKIEANARRCKRIVENLLAFSRQSRLDRQRANINEVIQSVIALNEYQFHLDNVEMTKEFDTRIPAIGLDVSRWQQVFINLAQNAREAMVEGASPTRKISFRTQLKGTEIVVRVEDTGPGIPRHLLGRVFDPFFTTRSHGTGLGLGLCFGIVSDHGGTITAESEPGRGAVFTIRVPCAVAPPEQPHEPLQEARPSAPRAGAGLRVLVVDDEAVVRDVVQSTLEMHGYEVDAAGDSTQALALVASSSFDAVLTDLRMPGELDGFGLLLRLRQTHPALAARVVFMTGLVSEPDVLSQIEKMGLKCVGKPFDIRELARVVNSVTRSTPLGKPA